jgi:hypothetical protein
LIEELNDFPKIEDPDQEFEFELLGGEFRLAKPIMKEREDPYINLIRIRRICMYRRH